MSNVKKKSNLKKLGKIFTLFVGNDIHGGLTLYTVLSGAKDLLAGNTLWAWSLVDFEEMLRFT